MQLFQYQHSLSKLLLLYIYGPWSHPQRRTCRRHAVCGFCQSKPRSSPSHRRSTLHRLRAEVAGQHIITESVGGQVVGQYVHPMSAPVSLKSGGEDLVTMGEALEAAALSAAQKPVEQSDAAAIQAAEVRATRRMQVIPGGVVARAQGAASENARTRRDEEKTKLGDVLTDASSVLPKDKVVTREDAKGVIRAEIRNQPELATYPGGVAASMAAAARLNQNK